MGYVLGPEVTMVTQQLMHDAQVEAESGLLASKTDFVTARGLFDVVTHAAWVAAHRSDPATNAVHRLLTRQAAESLADRYSTVVCVPPDDFPPETSGHRGVANISEEFRSAIDQNTRAFTATVRQMGTPIAFVRGTRTERVRETKAFLAAAGLLQKASSTGLDE